MMDVRMAFHEAQHMIPFPQRCLSNLPSHVILEILSRLSIKTIIHCKCVCKTWLKLLSGPEFANLHLSKSPKSLIINQFDSLLPDENDVLKLIELKNEPDDHDIQFDSALKFNCTLISTELFLLGLCNGMLLLNCICDDSLYICNPILREYIALPRAEGVRKHHNLAAYGFGYSSQDDQYKVVRIYQEQSIDRKTCECTYCNSEGQVYTLGTGLWRSVEHVYFAFGSGSAGVQLNDNLHWFVYDPQGDELICSFDLNRESYQPIPPPPGLGSETIGTLGVLGSCLCLSDTTMDFAMELWVMKKYGIKESWTKGLAIRRPDYWLSYVLIYPLEVFKDGEILFLCCNHPLFSCHPEKKVVNGYNIYKPAFEAIVHVSSFLSLKNFVGEEVNKF